MRSYLSVHYFFYSIGWLVSCSSLYAVLPTESAFKSCVQQMSSSLGRYESIAQGLSFYYVTQGSWIPIASAFQKQLRRLPTELEEAAMRITPNPLHPYDDIAAQKLLQTVILKMWVTSLNYNNANGQNIANTILNYIIQQQPEDIRRCLLKELEATTQPARKR